MANVNRPSGFLPVGHLNGDSWNGKVNKYYIASAGKNVFIGDMMKLKANASSVGYPCVDLADATTDIPIGPVYDIVVDADSPEKTYIPANGSGYMYIADDPDLVMRVQCNGTLQDGDLGSKCSVTAGTGSTTTMKSAYEIDVSTCAATHTLVYHVLQVVDEPGNALGADADVLVCFNIHEYGHGCYCEQDGSSAQDEAGHVGVHA